MSKPDLAKVERGGQYPAPNHGKPPLRPAPPPAPPAGGNR